MDHVHPRELLSVEGSMNGLKEWASEGESKSESRRDGEDTSLSNRAYDGMPWEDVDYIKPGGTAGDYTLVPAQIVGRECFLYVLSQDRNSQAQHRKRNEL